MTGSNKKMTEECRRARRVGRVPGTRRGFTLIELMIVVAVIAILASIAYPGYQEFVRKARRADGKEALVRVQIEQEKWRTNNTAYTSTLGATGLGLQSTSSEGHYNLAITASSTTDFTATATGRGSQASDTGCTVLQITRTAKTPAACW